MKEDKTWADRTERHDSPEEIQEALRPVQIGGAIATFLGGFTIGGIIGMLVSAVTKGKER